jgi:hypothetical protein
VSVWCFLGSAGDGNDDYELLQLVPVVEGIIGTAPSCAMRLRDPMLTPEHARVLFREGAWYLGGIAVGSPTLVNARATLPGEAVQLAQGDVVQVGSARFRFGGEPPNRDGVDAKDEVAVAMLGDRLAEAGSPLGLRILEKQSPSPEWLFGFEEQISAGLVTPEWTRGLLTGLTVREVALRHLRMLLADEASVALERLSIAIATCEDTSPFEQRRPEKERVRALFQMLAETRPPRLRRLELGWIHADISGADRDWRAIARRIPLEGTLDEAHRRAGGGRFTMLRSGGRWPEVGTVTAYVPGGGWPEVSGAFFEAPEAFRRRRVNFSGEAGKAVEFSTELATTVNGLPSWDRRALVHGDVVEGKEFAFRFEEDP